jgi:hypothetical protein
MTVKRLEHGAKAYQRPDHEDRTLDYRNLRRTFSNTPYTNDIDMVEWRNENGQVSPVAILELTRIDANSCGGQYLQAILDRFHCQGQASFILKMSERLLCDAYIVAYYQDLTLFHLYNLTAKKGWATMNAQHYEKWLQSLTPEVIREKRRVRNDQRG